MKYQEIMLSMLFIIWIGQGENKQPAAGKSDSFMNDS